MFAKLSTDSVGWLRQWLMYTMNCPQKLHNNVHQNLLWWTLVAKRMGEYLRIALDMVVGLRHRTRVWFMHINCGILLWAINDGMGSEHECGLDNGLNVNRLRWKPYNIYYKFTTA